MLVLFHNYGFSQEITNEDLKQQIKTLTERVVKLEANKEKQKVMINTLSSELDSLKNQTETNHSAIITTKNNLDIKIRESEKTNDDKIFALGQSLSKNSLIGIIGVLFILLISGILFWLLSKRQRHDKTELSVIIRNTKSELEKESTKLDVQLLDVIEKQLKVADKINAQETNIDHTFHKNSANELMKITNFSKTLDPQSQEAIALSGSLGRLRNYFNSSSYEIIDFTGQVFDERIPMKVKETVFDETLPLGKEIISRTIKPQIKYNGVVIQDAEVITKYHN